VEGCWAVEGLEIEHFWCVSAAGMVMSISEGTVRFNFDRISDRRQRCRWRIQTCSQQARGCRFNSADES